MGLYSCGTRYKHYMYMYFPDNTTSCWPVAYALAHRLHNLASERHRRVNAKSCQRWATGKNKLGQHLLLPLLANDGTMSLFPVGQRCPKWLWAKHSFRRIIGWPNDGPAALPYMQVYMDWKNIQVPWRFNERSTTETLLKLQKRLHYNMIVCSQVSDSVSRDLPLHFSH